MVECYIPFLYTLRTRYNTTINRISFFIITVFPSLFFVVILKGFCLSILVDYFVMLLGMHSVYECGYLFNDLVTVRYENNPTMRFTKEKADGLLKHLQNMLTLRLTVALFATWYIVERYYVGSIVVPLMTVLLVVYTLHNFYRNRINIITMCFMVTLKYLIPCVPFVEESALTEIFIFLFVSIPLLRTIEYAAKDRYGLKFLTICNYEVFRIKFYAIVVVMLSTAIYLNFVKAQYLVLPVCLFFFRVGTFFIMRNKRVSSVINANRKRNGI